MQKAQLESGDTPRGTFICIEGIDAVGKRTQSSRLNSWLASKSLTTAVLSFPDYNTRIGREIKTFLTGENSYIPEVRAMLYTANRWEKDSELRAVLSKSDVLIVNRYSPSNIAYGLSNGLGLNWLLNLEEGLPKPDLVLVLDTSAENLSSRRVRDKDTYERDIDFQERTRRNYLRLAQQFGWKVIDASGGIESTGGQVRAAVTQFLSARGRTV